MHRFALIVLLSLVACRDRGRDVKRAPEGSAGSGSATAAVPSAPAAMPDSYARLVGDKPATPGSALASLHLGEVIDPEKVPEVPATSFGLSGEAEPRIFRRATTGAEPKVLVNLEIRADKLFALRIELLTEKGSIPEDKCAAFARALEAKWGPAPERVWVDSTAHVRAALRDTCILTFEHYTDVASWIGPEPTSIVPAFVVGKKPTELSRRVGSWTNLGENLTFRDVGVGEHASGPTVLDVYQNKGKVIGLSAETPASAADRAAIRERISSAFGAKPTHDATTGYDVWATKVPIRMLDTPSGVRVEVGRLNP
jgi:hypothetical protein